MGSGLGETTKMLCRFMATDGECVGVEQDEALLDAARGQDWGGRRVRFEQGDTTSLPFKDGSFDFVFSRYLLMHVTEPLKAIQEMLRVAKPGGVVLAHEPDLEFTCCYPPNTAYERIPEMWARVIPHPLIGRELFHLFREAGAKSPRAAADAIIEYDSTDLKRLYRMSFEAIGAALTEAGTVPRAEFEEQLTQFRTVEADPSITIIPHPNIAVWTTV